MGNWETLVSYQVGHRVLRLLRVVCAGLLPLVPLCQAVAADCDSNLADLPAIDLATLQIRGETPVRRTLTAPAGSDLMVFARERGVDIALEVMDAAGHVLGRGDNPIRRTGVQRVPLTAQAPQRYDIVVTGKDRGDSNGSVEIRVVDLTRSNASSCVSAQKILARADAAYAAGQAVTRAASTASGVSSEKSYQDAAAGYRETASILEPTGASPLLAQAQLAEASLFNFDVDNYMDAKDWAAKAARTFASLGDAYGKARAQAIGSAAALDVAVAAKSSGSTDSGNQASAMLAEARGQLEEVVAFHASRREFYDQAWAQNIIGIAFYYEGRYDEAIRAYEKALPPYERLHERPGRVQVLQNVALVEYELGRYSDSVTHFHRALKLIKRDENPKLVAAVLSNSALASAYSGNEDMALRQLAESLALAQTIQDAALQSIDLDHIALVYARLGDQTRALDFYRQALASTQDARGRTASLRSMANILRQQGHASEALKLDREALSLTATSASRPRIQVQIAKDLIDLGRSTEAAEVLEALLSPAASTDEVDRARALHERARLRGSADDVAGAEADLRIALKTFKSYELPLDEFETWVSLAKLAHRRGALAEAFSTIDQALALAEEVRLQSANPELRSTLLQPLRPAFDLKISMLSEQYAAAGADSSERVLLATRALETAEQARARALADYQTLDVTAPGLDRALLDRRQSLYRELAARRVRLEALLDRKGPTNIQSQAIRSEIASLRREVDQIDAKVGAASQGAMGLHAGGARQSSLPLANIPADAAIIEYWVGETASFAWVVTRNGITMTPLGASADINVEANTLHTALRSFGTLPKARRLDAGRRLFASVLQPIEGQIAAAHTLIFALDGALHYVPFATLRYMNAGREIFLVENHDIAVTPSIQLFLKAGPTRSTPHDSRKMLLVDDPVYDPRDPRVTHLSSAAEAPGLNTSGSALALVRGPGSSGYLPRLPGAAREAAAIAALMPAESVDRLDGFAANRDRFLASALDQYRLIHVASHATTDPEIPQASALVLSTVDADGKEIDGRVLGADFMGIRLRADTVVLSACETALGKNVAGEGLVGLQYAVLARGARSVVSSLWPALDQVTAELMVGFYSALLHRPASVISAWSAASRAALAEPRADPGTWGAFMLTLSHVEDLQAH